MQSIQDVSGNVVNSVAFTYLLKIGCITYVYYWCNKHFNVNCYSINVCLFFIFIYKEILIPLIGNFNPVIQIKSDSVLALNSNASFSSSRLFINPLITESLQESITDPLQHYGKPSKRTYPPFTLVRETKLKASIVPKLDHWLFNFLSQLLHLVVMKTCSLLRILSVMLALDQVRPPWFLALGV